MTNGADSLLPWSQVRNDRLLTFRKVGRGSVTTLATVVLAICSIVKRCKPVLPIVKKAMADAIRYRDNTIAKAS